MQMCTRWRIRPLKAKRLLRANLLCLFPRLPDFPSLGIPLPGQLVVLPYRLLNLFPLLPCHLAPGRLRHQARRKLSALPVACNQSSCGSSHHSRTHRVASRFPHQHRGNLHNRYPNTGNQAGQPNFPPCTAPTHSTYLQTPYFTVIERHAKNNPPFSRLLATPLPPKRTHFPIHLFSNLYPLPLTAPLPLLGNTRIRKHNTRIPATPISRQGGPVVISNLYKHVTTQQRRV